MSKKDWEAVVENGNDVVDESHEEVATKETVEPAGALEHPSYEELEERVTQLEEALRLKTDEGVRIAADAKNMERRSLEEVRKAKNYALTEFARDMLAVSDSLEHALKTCKEHPVMQEGIELTQRQLFSALERFGVKSFDPTGEKFDPICHEAMTMIEDPNVDSGKVITVFQKGYWIADRLLRPARVVVSK